MFPGTVLTKCSVSAQRDEFRRSYRSNSLYTRRNDAESINRAYDDTLWLRRARSVGQARQRLNLLTYALAVTPRAAPPPAH